MLVETTDSSHPSLIAYYWKKLGLWQRTSERPDGCYGTGETGFAECDGPTYTARKGPSDNASTASPQLSIAGLSVVTVIPLYGEDRREFYFRSRYFRFRPASLGPPTSFSGWISALVTSERPARECDLSTDWDGKTTSERSSSISGRSGCDPSPTWKSDDRRGGKPAESVFKRGFSEIYTDSDTLKWHNFTVRCLCLPSSLMVPCQFKLNSTYFTTIFRTYTFHDTY